MAAEASPPRLGVGGGLPEPKKGALRRRPTEGDSEEGAVCEFSDGGPSGRSRLYFQNL